MRPIYKLGGFRGLWSRISHRRRPSEYTWCPGWQVFTSSSGIFHWTFEFSIEIFSSGVFEVSDHEYHINVNLRGTWCAGWQVFTSSPRIFLLIFEYSIEIFYSGLLEVSRISHRRRPPEYLVPRLAGIFVWTWKDLAVYYELRAKAFQLESLLVWSLKRKHLQLLVETKRLSIEKKSLLI